MANAKRPEFDVFFYDKQAGVSLKDAKRDGLWARSMCDLCFVEALDAAFRELSTNGECAMVQIKECPGFGLYEPRELACITRKDAETLKKALLGDK